MPLVQPTMTLGSIGIMLSVMGSIGAGVYFIIKATSGIQRVFSKLETQIVSLQLSMNSQDGRLDKIESEIKSQTQILINQHVQEANLAVLSKKVDSWDAKVDRLVDQISQQRLGAMVSQSVKGRPGQP